MDRRKNAVSTTDEGVRPLRRREKAARAADELLVPLSAIEREQFTALLIRISGTDG